MRPIRIASCIALKLLPPPDTKIASFAGFRKLRGTGSSAACNCAQQVSRWPRFTVHCLCLPNTKALRWYAAIYPCRESFAALRREQDASLDEEQAHSSMFEESSSHHGHGQYKQHNNHLSGILFHVLASDPLRCAAKLQLQLMPPP